MARKIDVDDEVYAWLQRQARPFEDTPNSVLRRVAGLGATQGDSPAQAVSLAHADRRLMAPRPMTKERRTATMRAGKAKRQQVIDKYRLRRKSRHGKICEDANRNMCWVFVGYGNFHGISKDMVEVLSQGVFGKFLFGKCIGDSIRVYEGSLADLQPHLEELPLSERYQARTFHLGERNDHLFIKEAPSVRLEFIGEIGPTET